MNQKRTLKSLKEGDKDAFKLIFELHYKPLCNYLQTFTHDYDGAEEIAQATFVCLWSKRKQIEIKTSLKSYLYKMAYNNFAQTYRDKKKYDVSINKIIYETLHDNFIDNEDVLNKKIALLKKSINNLPQGNKNVLKLKQEGYKNKEIASQLNISIKTVESHIRKAFIKIKKDFSNNNLYLFFLKKI